MRKLFAGIAAVSLAACGYGANASDEVRDAGEMVDRSYDVGEFSKIAVSGPYEVEVNTGGTTAVTAMGGENLLDETEVIVEDGTLKIRPKKRKMRWSWNLRGNNARFQVSTAMLEGAAIAGSGGINVDNVDGDFEGAVAGSGDIEVAAMSGGNASMEIAGSGDIKYAGTANRIEIEIAGSGDADASGLSAQNGSVSIAGSGDVQANISGDADINIAGSGDVRIEGGANCKVSKVGSGDVTCN